MKKILTIAILGGLAMTMYAVPARRGWQTRTQADGTTIEIQQMGDEFYHYMINRDGKEVREADGMYIETGEAPTAQEASARRARGMARRQRKAVGLTPNLAPKGVVILANFADSEMEADHNQDIFKQLCNDNNCTVNKYGDKYYGSAAQYFSDQSNGTYRPQFDVFGPVTLSRNVAYYGKDKEGAEEGDDQHATDAVVEACLLANAQFDIDFTQYDSDKDGYVDFVYVIYAGMGQADGGAATTIWPHNWEIEDAIFYGYCTYQKSQCVVDGKKLNTYAMSGELNGYNGTFNGIATLCHEFGHVMGLPDLYDTSYGTVYKNCLTPNDWDVMDGGTYNGDGHCPPNYNPWEKQFFGWDNTEALGNVGKRLELLPNGTEGAKAYQINFRGTLMGATDGGLRYYIENRQNVGWDAELPAHGMLVWKVNFTASAWQNNAPNNSSTTGAPLFTIVSASGTKIGWDGKNDNSPMNPFPGSEKVTSWTPAGITGKPVKDITEKDGVISLIYIGVYKVNWVVNGETVETGEYSTSGSDLLELPSAAVTPCEGTRFAGWTEEAAWLDPFAAPADIFTSADGRKVTGDKTYYAVFE